MAEQQQEEEKPERAGLMARKKMEAVEEDGI